MGARGIALALLAGLALVAAPAAAQVPDRFAHELAQRLVRAEAGRGYVLGAGPFSGGMSADETRRIPLTLRAGEDYRMVGVCDARCSAPRLALHDASGARLADGAATANGAVMDVRVPFTGGYELELRLPRCAGERCWYAVNVYGR